MKFLYVIGCAFLVGSGIIYVVSPTPFLTDILAVAAAVLPVAAAGYTYLKVKERGKEGMVWLLLFIGLLLWLGGETLWFYLETVTQEVPYPSAADVSWLVAYPVLFAAFYREYTRLDVDVGTKKKGGILGVILLVLLIMTWALLYPIAVSDEVTIIEKVLDLAYPVGDLALLYTALLVTSVYVGGRLGNAWLLICIGFIIYAAADLSFSYMYWEEIYWSGNPLEVLWLIGDVIVFWGAAMYGKAYEMVG
ncbi:MAG: hypothetical protein PVF58_19080 [Candidatus Methanofastidiosia archaeon]|jgi:hypothetical protein